MATANSVTFRADKDALFAAAIQIIQGAGYIISETNDAARKIIYYADQKAMGLQYRYEVTITVSGATGFAAETALFTMRVIGLPYDFGQFMGAGIAEDAKFENDVINFVKNSLQKQYPIEASVTPATDAPGAGGQTGGCLVALGFLGLLATGGGLGCLMLLATLIP
jgi:hypothetical protein